MNLKPPYKINKDLLIYKSFYFFYFGALGSINPYLPVYLRQIGLSAFAVGLLVGVRPIIQLASAPFWTVVADKFKKRKSIFVMSIMAWLIMTISLVFVEPTEEICEVTAKNGSHKIFVNFSKHKTGFFKRSMDDPVELSLRFTRSTKAFQENAPIVHTHKILKESIQGNESLVQTISRNQRHNDRKNYSSEIKFEHSMNDGLNNDKEDDKRNVNAKGVLIKQKDRTHPESLLSKTGSMTKRLNTSLNIGNVSLADVFSTAAHSLSKRKKLKTSTSSLGDYQTSDRPSEEQEVFDPFNMNGKSKSSVGAELAKFFATSYNHTSKKSTDIHYYNMNGAEHKHLEYKNTTIHSSKVKNKLKKRKPGRNRTLNTHVMKGYRKNTDIKHRNETLKVEQTNLFKTNRNEMKRLFVILLVLIVVGEFLETPSAPLSDASLLEYLGKDRIHYGKQRLWGSLGHGIASFIVGTLMERSRHLTCGEDFIDYTMSFSVFTVFMLITLIIAANFTFRYKDVEEKESSVLSTVLTVHYLSFLTAVCYMGMSHGLLHNFLMWFLEDLGGSKTLMGLSTCSRNAADLIMFFIVSQLIEIFGQIKIVFISLIAYGTIFIAYSTMSNPWYALGVEFLGGFTFAASWTACTSYLAEAAPQESVTTMQGKYAVYKMTYNIDDIHISYIKIAKHYMLIFRLLPSRNTPRSLLGIRFGHWLNIRRTLYPYSRTTLDISSCSHWIICCCFIICYYTVEMAKRKLR